MFKQFAIAIFALISLSALANEEIKMVQGLLPEGLDIAQIERSRERASEDELMALAKRNYIIADLNKDGLKDVLVIAEEKTEFRTYRDDRPCSEGSDDCMTIHGKRTLNLFLGKRDGTFEYNFINSDLVRSADEGGMMGDPLAGLELKKNGVIKLTQDGGSADRWSYVDTFQFQKDDLYVIGQDNKNFNTNSMGEFNKSANLVNGLVIETSRKSGDAPLKTKRYYAPVKPLIPVSVYKGQDA
jgi:hypothetical protein